MLNFFLVFEIIVLVFFASCTHQRKVGPALENGVQEMPHRRVHFYFDKDTILPDELGRLNENISWLNQNRDSVVILEGHCDELGTSIYNMELGDRRARAVKSYLIENGIDHNRIIMVVSLGETRPVNLQHNNEAWKMNRRVEFIIR